MGGNETMTEDIFDRIEGYEQLHEILTVLNKAMIECENLHSLGTRQNLKLNFNVKVNGELKKITGIEIHNHREIETLTEVGNITFVIEEE